MFGKANPSNDNKLSERIRKATARETAPPLTQPWMRRVERAVRQAVFKQGALLLADGESFPVALKNISATGARVEYFTRRELPAIVVLVEPSLRIKARAKVVWQRDGIAGLAFVLD